MNMTLTNESPFKLETAIKALRTVRNVFTRLSMSDCGDSQHCAFRSLEFEFESMRLQLQKASGGLYGSAEAALPATDYEADLDEDLNLLDLTSDCEQVLKAFHEQDEHVFMGTMNKVLVFMTCAFEEVVLMHHHSSVATTIEYLINHIAYLDNKHIQSLEVETEQVIPLAA